MIKNEIELTADERPEVEAAGDAYGTLRKTLELWIAVGRGVVRLRERADRMGGRNTFQRLLEQNRLGGLYKSKAVLSKLERIMQPDNLAKVQQWHAKLDDHDRVALASPSSVIRHAHINHVLIFPKKKKKDGTVITTPQPRAPNKMHAEAAIDTLSDYCQPLAPDERMVIAERILGPLDLKGKPAKQAKPLTIADLAHDPAPVASPEDPQIKGVIEYLGALVKKLTHKQRIDLGVDICKEALRVATSQVNDRDYKRAEARGEIDELPIPMTSSSGKVPPEPKARGRGKRKPKAKPDPQEESAQPGTLQWNKEESGYTAPARRGVYRIDPDFLKGEALAGVLGGPMGWMVNHKVDGEDDRRLGSNLRTLDEAKANAQHDYDEGKDGGGDTKSEETGTALVPGTAAPTLIDGMLSVPTSLTPKPPKAEGKKAVKETPVTPPAPTVLKVKAEKETPLTGDEMHWWRTNSNRLAGYDVEFWCGRTATHYEFEIKPKSDAGKIIYQLISGSTLPDGVSGNILEELEIDAHLDPIAELKRQAQEHLREIIKEDAEREDGNDA
jgi:hypothetical protein